MQSLQRMQRIGSESLFCIDYLMAAADYMDFVSIMLDFKDVEEADFTEQQEIE